MAETNESFTRRHAGFATPEEIIFACITEHTSAIPVQRTKIVKGYDSEVYDVATKEGHAFIVKIKYYGDISYEQEKWAMDQCRAVGVPVPGVIAIGTVMIEEQEHEYMVQKKAKGQPFADKLETLTPAQINTVLYEAGEVLKRIHQVKVEGFYHRHPHAIWDFPSWQRFADSNVRERAKETRWFLQAGFSQREVETMLHALELYRDTFTCEQPVLCHGDYGLEHIFLDEELHISAILDFGMFLGSHPLHDFAYFHMEHPSQPLHILMDGYGDHEMFHHQFPERLRLHQLGLQMGYLAHFLHENMEPEAKFLIEALRATLNTQTEKH